MSSSACVRQIIRPVEHPNVHCVEACKDTPLLSEFFPPSTPDLVNGSTKRLHPRDVSSEPSTELLAPVPSV